jgi:protein-S-isoprenylcysteine O-methyltransferase Ste14
MDEGAFRLAFRHFSSGLCRFRRIAYHRRVTPLGWLAAVVLFLQLPIPLYWFVVHPQIDFWRRHGKAGYITGLLCSWPPVSACLFVFRRQLFRTDWPRAWAVTAGLALILFEGWLFWRLTRDLGADRLMGKTEMSGGGTIASSGIYARIRHPRYAGSFLAIVGACLLAAKPALWAVAAAWAALMRLAIYFEEREMRRRFGPAFEEYARRVPRFLPRLGPRLGRGGKAAAPAP